MKTTLVAVIIGLVIVTAAAGRSTYTNKRSAEGKHVKQEYGGYKQDKQRSVRGKREFAPEGVQESEEQVVGEPDQVNADEPSYASYRSKSSKYEKYPAAESFKKANKEKTRYSKEEASEAPVSGEFEQRFRSKRSPGTFTRGGAVLSNPELIVDTISDVPLPPVSPDHPGTRVSLDASQIAERNQRPKFMPVSAVTFEDKLNQILEELRLWRLAQEINARRQSQAEEMEEAAVPVTADPISSDLDQGEEVFRVADVDTVEEIQRILRLYREYTAQNAQA